MTKLSRFLVILVVLFFTGKTVSKDEISTPLIDIKIIEGGWGDANIANIQAVLKSVVKEQIQFLRISKPIVIEVSYNESRPIVLYKQGQRGEYIVNLAVTGRYWDRYSYQFSHELCHIQTNYKETPKTFIWLNESICDIVPYYVLNKMSLAWAKAPPYENWRSYAPNFKNYADGIRSAWSRTVKSISPAKWYLDNLEELQQRPYGDSRQRLFTASHFLFSAINENPEMLLSMSFIDRNYVAGNSDLPSYLAAWQIRLPEVYKVFPNKIKTVFMN